MNAPASAFPEGGDAALCRATTDARGNSKVPALISATSYPHPSVHFPTPTPLQVDDTWCVENCGFNPPNCPLSLCECDDSPPEEAAGKEETDKKEAAPGEKGDWSKGAFERRRNINSGGDVDEAFQRGKEEYDRLRRASAGTNGLSPGQVSNEPDHLSGGNEAPMRKCQSEWDGNCDRSAFTGKAGAARKRRIERKLAIAKGEISGSDAETDGKQDQEEEEEDVSKLGNDSGLEDGAEPEDCVTVGGAVSDAWCKTACAGSPPNCPAELCSCEKIVKMKTGGEGVHAPAPTPSPSPSPYPCPAPASARASAPTPNQEEEGESSDVPGVGGFKIDAVCGPKIGIKCGQKVVNGGYKSDDVSALPLAREE